jgi:uncharacterized membrane protein YdjX (TVP38/TMEM64 family)
MTPLNPQAQTVQSASLPVGKIVLVALFALAIGAFFYFDLNQYFSLEVLKANRDRLLAYTAANSVESVLVFIALYCLQTAFSLPGAWAFTLAAGFLFGSVLGTLYANIAATAGATLAFLASRYLLHDWVERKFGNRLGPIQEGFAKNAFSYLMTLRLIPIFPFFLINLVAGVTRIRLGTYVLATAIGIIPGTFVYANAGRQLGTINSLGEIVSVRVLGAFFLLALLAVVPVLYKKFARKPV